MDVNDREIEIPIKLVWPGSQLCEMSKRNDFKFSLQIRIRERCDSCQSLCSWPRFVFVSKIYDALRELLNGKPAYVFV